MFVNTTTMEPVDSERNSHEQEDDFEEAQEDHVARPRELPNDLPRSLDDRQNFSSYNQETEYYDAWQGEREHFRVGNVRATLTLFDQANRNSSQLRASPNLSPSIFPSTNPTLTMTPSVARTMPEQLKCSPLRHGAWMRATQARQRRRTS